MLIHIVCWRIKEDANGNSKQENIQKMKEILEGLPAQITEIKGFDVGINFNTSDTAYDLSLYSVFDDEKGLDTYQNHPAHVEAGKFIKAVTKDRAVVDYFR